MSQNQVFGVDFRFRSCTWLNATQIKNYLKVINPSKLFLFTRITTFTGSALAEYRFWMLGVYSLNNYLFKEQIIFHIGFSYVVNMYTSGLI